MRSGRVEGASSQFVTLRDIGIRVAEASARAASCECCSPSRDVGKLGQGESHLVTDSIAPIQRNYHDLFVFFAEISQLVLLAVVYVILIAGGCVWAFNRAHTNSAKLPQHFQIQICLDCSRRNYALGHACIMFAASTVKVSTRSVWEAVSYTHLRAHETEADL
eukprot:5635136-Amphidinium_carterae.2